MLLIIFLITLRELTVFLDCIIRSFTGTYILTVNLYIKRMPVLPECAYQKIFFKNLFQNRKKA